MTTPTHEPTPGTREHFLQVTTLPALGDDPGLRGALRRPRVFHPGVLRQGRRPHGAHPRAAPAQGGFCTVFQGIKRGFALFRERWEGRAQSRHLALTPTIAYVIIDSFHAE